MSAPDRRAMVERPGEGVSVRRQCELLNVARSGVYRPKPVAEADDLALMRRIDELHLELPFYGSRRMTFQLNEEGRGVNRKRVQRLMRVMGIDALVAQVHLKAYADGREARAGIGLWMTFYNFRRPHQAMNNQMPMAVWRAGMDRIEAAARPVDMPLRLDNANALPTYPQ